MKAKGLVFGIGLVVMFVLAADAVAQAVRMSGSRRNRGGAAETTVAGENSFTDSRDGKTYRTVRIGNLTWMAENLNHRTKDSWCYADDPSNCEKYGRLYTWAAAQTACPAGWRLAGHDEQRTDWTDLMMTVGGTFRDGVEYMSWENAGAKLKSRTGWNDHDRDDYIPATDDFGFSALPGGFRDFYGNFSNLGVQGYWWSTAGRLVSGPGCEPDCGALTHAMASPSNTVTMFDYPKSVALSVRCVQN